MEENKLAVKPLGLLMLELSIPAIIAQLVSIIYNMVDRIFIGRIENGTNAMAALSVSLPVRKTRKGRRRSWAPASRP